MRERLGRLHAWLAGQTRNQRRLWARRLALATPAALLALALSAGPPVHANNIVVDAGVVVIATDGDCSLREAIVNANDDAATHADCAAGGGPDTIILPAAGTFTVPDVDNLTDGENGLPSVTSVITIDGNGSIIERDPMDADTFRLFHVAPSGDLTLDATTLRYGVADDTTPGDNGGGIFSTYAALTVTNGSVISGNQAEGEGGGVFVYRGPLEIADSTITGNRADDLGGGIYVRGDYAGSSDSTTITDSSISSNTGYIGGGMATVYTALTISGSTISDNTAISAISFVGGGGLLIAFDSASISHSTVSGNAAAVGGGVQNFGANLRIDHCTIFGNTAAYGGGLTNLFFTTGYGAVELTNSTISGNYATYSGGGIFSGDSLAIRNATITGNSASRGAGVTSGVLSPYSTAYVTNSIIADQLFGGDCHAPNMVSGDFNLDSDNSCGFTQANDIPGGNANLDPLALNAPGTTATHALLPGSDALDAGDCSGGAVTDDQRTVSRPQGAACDIGAYELEGAPTPVPPTAAMLAGFAASQDASGRVSVTWQTTAEADIVGFNLYRSVGPSGPWLRANPSLIPARGGAASGADYQYEDDDPRDGAEILRYRLEVVNSSGPPQSFGPVDAIRRLFRALLPWVLR